LRRLRQFPTHEQLALSLTSLPVAGAMAQYGEEIIRHELIIDAEHIDHPGRIPPTAEAILAGLRIRTGAEVVCPAVCEHSWAALPSSPPNGCRAYHFERGLSHQITAQPRVLLPDDLEWVRENLGAIIRLTESELFENQCHWVLDVIFGEDGSRKRAEHGAENVAWLRRMALSLLSNEPTPKLNLKQKSRRALCNHDFLLKVLEPVLRSQRDA
jgi:hypothetical protein